MQAAKSDAAHAGASGAKSAGRSAKPDLLIPLVVVCLLPVVVMGIFQATAKDEAGPATVIAEDGVTLATGGEEPAPGIPAQEATAGEERSAAPEAQGSPGISEQEATAGWERSGVPEAQGSVIVTYANGVITEEDFRSHYHEMPAWMRGPDTPANRRGQLRALLNRRLLAWEASGVPLTAEERSLPRVLRERIQMARFVDRQVNEESPGLTGAKLSRARHRKALSLASQSRQTFLPSIDEDALAAVDLSRPPPRVSRDAEDILALPPESRRPFQGRFTFSSDSTIECTGEVAPHTAAITGSCGCESLTEFALWEDQLHFELYLSGRGLNAINTYNVEAAPCRKLYVSAGSTYTAEAKQAMLSTIQRGFDGVELKSPDVGQQRAFSAMLEVSGERIGQCLYDDLDGRPGRIPYTANWTQLPDGRTVGMKVSSASGVHRCVQKILQDWRFPGLVREPTDLEARFTLSVHFDRLSEEEESENVRRTRLAGAQQVEKAFPEGVTVSVIHGLHREHGSGVRGQDVKVKGVYMGPGTNDPFRRDFLLQQDRTGGPSIVCYTGGRAPILPRFTEVTVLGKMEGSTVPELRNCGILD